MWLNPEVCVTKSSTNLYVYTIIISFKGDKAITFRDPIEIAGN